MAPIPDLTPGTLAERDELVQLQRLEVQLATAPDSKTGRGAVKDCLRAIQWIEYREDGQTAFSWGPRGPARNTVIALGLLVLTTILLRGKPITPWFVVGELGIWVVFGLGGGIWLGRFAWRSASQAYQKQLVLARSQALPMILPRSSGHR